MSLSHDAWPYVAAALLALLIGPALFRISRALPSLLPILDGFVLASVGGLALLMLLPEAVAAEGWPILLAALAGLAVPVWVERFGGIAHGRVHAVGLILAMAGLFVHTTIDGMALVRAGGERAADHVLALAVVLHRLPVGVALWWLVRPVHGARIAGLGLLFIAAGTAVGAFLGQGQGESMSGGVAAWFQALVTGTLLHVVLHSSAPMLTTRDGPVRPVAQSIGALFGVALVLAVPQHEGEGTFGHAVAGALATGAQLGSWILAAGLLAAFLLWRGPMRIAPVWVGALGIDGLLLGWVALGARATAIRIAWGVVVLLVASWAGARFRRTLAPEGSVGAEDHGASAPPHARVRAYLHAQAAWVPLALLVGAMWPAPASLAEGALPQGSAWWAPVLACAVTGMLLAESPLAVTLVAAMTWHKGVPAEAVLSLLLVAPALALRRAGRREGAPRHRARASLVTAWVLALFGVALGLALGPHVTPGLRAIAPGALEPELFAAVLALAALAVSCRIGPRGLIEPLVQGVARLLTGHDEHAHDHGHEHGAAVAHPHAHS